MLDAAEQLSHACTKAADNLSTGEVGAREIKELAAAMKELTALRITLSSGTAADSRDTVKVVFDDDSDICAQ